MGIRVGVGNADIMGSDNRALQAAVEYVAGLGGGEVEVSPGVYIMQDSLHLRSNVVLRGSNEATILRKCDGYASRLEADGDYGEEQVTVIDPSGFKVGMGVTIMDAVSEGFHITVRTITGMDQSTLLLNGPLLSDYMVDKKAVAKNAFPIISGYHIESSKVVGLRLEGNKEANESLDGCRGGGVFLYGAKRLQIKGVEAYNYNGDGISFQKSDDILVEGCVCRGNTGLGLHPGSGSQRPIAKNNRLLGNGQIGLYLCWRVRNGIFEANEIRGNGETGISIGHKDTDNIFRDNLVVENGVSGIHFRDEAEPMGGHRNLIRDNVIRDNGGEKGGYGIRIDGETYDIEIVDNEITDTRQVGEKKQRVGIYIGEKANRISLGNNRAEGNADTAVQDARIK
jgi:hypothetical protein